MSLLLETIKLKNGKLFNIDFHNRRYNESRKTCFDISKKSDLSQLITIPEDYINGLFKCRVVYSHKIESINITPYKSPKIKSLKLIECNSINYKYKYANRDQLQKLFDERGNYDDILIVKNGCITDSYAANPVFFDGNKWWTPDTPLLPGTQRTRLLHEKKIFECRITPDDLHKYYKVGLINALNDLNDMPKVNISNIGYNDK